MPPANPAHILADTNEKSIKSVEIIEKLRFKMVWYHRNRKKAPKTTIFSGNFTRVLDGIGRVLDVF